MPTFGQKQICLWNAITHNWRIWCNRTKVSRGGYALRWRHNARDSVSHHQPHDCLLNRLFRHRSKKTSKLRVTGLCAGNSPGPVNFPHKWPVTRKMFPFDDVIMECRNWIGLVYTTNHTNYMHTARNLVFDQQHFICPICGNLYRKLPHMYMVLIDTDVMDVMWWTIRIYHDIHDDVIKWKHFPRYWLFVRGIHRSLVNSPHKRQWRGALMFSLICARINDWVNNREAGDLRRYRAHYDVVVMRCENLSAPARTKLVGLATFRPPSNMGSSMI